VSNLPIGEGRTGIQVQIIAPNRLVRSGLRLLVESGEGIVVISELNRIEDARMAVLLSTPDVIVVDMEHESARTLDDLCAMSKTSRVLVLAPHDAADVARSLRGASGILPTHRAEETLVQAIRTVHHSGRWPTQPASLE
jgi:DNA-binding NarL/FixJ family response regulator